MTLEEMRQFTLQGSPSEDSLFIKLACRRCAWWSWFTADLTHRPDLADVWQSADEHYEAHR